jgi:hypothetical protein
MLQNDVRVCAYDRRGYGWYVVCLLATHDTVSRDVQVVSSPLHQQRFASSRCQRHCTLFDTAANEAFTAAAHVMAHQRCNTASDPGAEAFAQSFGGATPLRACWSQRWCNVRKHNGISVLHDLFCFGGKHVSS